MKSMFRCVKKFPAHIQFGLIAQGVIVTIAGLIMPRHGAEVVTVGGVWTVLAVFLVVGAQLILEAGPVVEGEIVEQQPQLTDVQAHMRRTYELPQVS